MSDAPVLELRGITKQFPGVLANDHIDLELRRGEVHALLGENGAGKSTLMNILYGLYHPDEGEILLSGGAGRLRLRPRTRSAHGIGMVHQHFMLIPVMTVAENIVLAAEPTKAGIMLDFGEATKRVRELSERFGLAVEPTALVEDITVAQEQRVEILKALYRGAEILILDEPTAVLTPQEAKELFSIIDSLKAQGKSIVFITHKLHEVLEVADRITVLRRGRKIDTVPVAGATEEGLARMMVGREVLLRVEKPPAKPGETLLDVKDLHVFDDRGLEKVAGVSFHVCAGEIVGIAGVDGNGQTELIDAITGLHKVAAGTVTVAGREMDHNVDARAMLDAGVGHIPQDRQRRGLVLEFSIAENFALHDYNKDPDSKWGRLYPGRLIENARKLIEEFDVRGGGPRTKAGALSGGNQQKVVVAREVSRDPRVLIAAQPTRGLDVGAIEYVHRRLVAERDEGRAVLLVSLELDEVMSLSDRILVMFEGEIVAEYGAGVREEELGIAMMGGGRKKRRRRERRGARAHRSGEPDTARRRRADAGYDRAHRALPAGRRRRHPARHHRLRVRDGDDRRRGDRPQPVLDLQGDLQRQRAELAVSLGDGRGTDRCVVQPPADAGPDVLADARGVRRLVRLQVRPVQHRRAGPVHRRGAHLDVGRRVVRGDELRRCTSSSRSSSRRSPELLGGDRGLSEGDRRRARGDLDDHAQLDRVLGRDLPRRPWRPAPESRRPVESGIERHRTKARLPVFWGDPVLQGLHVGFFIALAMPVVYWLILNRTTLGFEVRATGFNPDAARYGGLNVRRSYMMAMAISGMFAGLAGALDILGWQFRAGRARHPGLEHRVHRDRGRAARSQLRDRGAARCVALRRAHAGDVDAESGDRGRLRSELAGNLSTIIQALVLLFIGADLLFIYLWQLRQKLRLA